MKSPMSSNASCAVIVVGFFAMVTILGVAFKDCLGTAFRETTPYHCSEACKANGRTMDRVNEKECVCAPASSAQP